MPISLPLDFDLNFFKSFSINFSFVNFSKSSFSFFLFISFEFSTVLFLEFEVYLFLIFLRSPIFLKKINFRKKLEKKKEHFYYTFSTCMQLLFSNSFNGASFEISFSINLTLGI